MTSTSATEQKLRKDAAANRERLLTAGRELFARRGLGVTLNDVAHHAGVGVGTAYRRFSNKEELIDAILERQNEEIEQILHAALAEPDPWTGLVLYLERSLRADATGTDLVFLQIALSTVAAVTQDGASLEGREDAEQLYRRYLRIALDGLRADGPTSQLPIPALTTAQTHTLLQPTRPEQDVILADAADDDDMESTS